MAKKAKNQVPREPEYAYNLTLQDIAYGGETVARLGEDFQREDATTQSDANDFDDADVDENELTLDSENSKLKTQNSKLSEVVFVAGGVPGEVVDVQLYRRKKSFLRGNVVRIIEPSHDRRAAPCPYFGVEKWPNCGGCQWQHVNYDRQLEFKHKILHDQFERIGGLQNPPLLPPVGAKSEWGYRNNVELSLDPHIGRLSFHRQNSIRLVPVESCHIAHPLVTLAIKPLEQALQKHLPGRVHQVTVRLGPVSTYYPYQADTITALAPYSDDPPARLNALEDLTGVEPLASALDRKPPQIMFVMRMLGQFAPPDFAGFVADMQAALDPYVAISILAEGKKHRLDVLCGTNYFEEVLNGVTYRVPAQGFFQSNSPMAEVLVNEALAALKQGGINLKGAKLLDLYCGVGTFALQMAAGGAQVLGVEEYEGAIITATENAKLNQLDKQTEFVAAKAEEYILELEREGQSYDAVVLDPPRRGCDPALLDSLLKLQPGVIVYVSCDPSTLARDVKILGQGYELVQSRAIDMFPQTYHLESVNLLKRRS